MRMRMALSYREVGGGQPQGKLRSEGFSALRGWGRMVDVERRVGATAAITSVNLAGSGRRHLRRGFDCFFLS